MVKYKWLWLFVMSAIIAFAASCSAFPVTQQPASAITAPQPATQPPTFKAEGILPIVNSFTTSASTIYTGQPVTLSWNVTDATTVTIWPDTVAVDASGTKQVTPARATTYTLVATNADGSVLSSRTVMLIPPQGTPDLTITHMWTSGAIMYFNVKNLGTGTSKQCAAYLYMDGPRVATAYVQPLAPGEQRIEEFPNYTVPMNPPSSADYVFEFKWDFKVCVDTENELAETDENNNCFAQTWGPVWGPAWGTPPWQKPEDSTPPQLNFNIFPHPQATIITE